MTTHFFTLALAGAVLLGLPCAAFGGEPVITEFLADNTMTLLDSDDEASDWIEIYNPGPGPAALAGWHLSDDPDDITRWTFPIDTQLRETEYMVVFPSGKDRIAASESFTERDSVEFAHALEFESGLFPSVEGEADGWLERGFVFNAPEPPSLSVRDGVLSFDTLGVRSGNDIRQSPTGSAWSAEIDGETSYTIEVRVRVTGQGGVTPGFNLWSGNGELRSAVFLSVETDRVVYGRETVDPALSVVLHMGDNASGFVTLRVAHDGETGKTYVWRNGNLIGTRLGRGITSSRHWLLLIDHGSRTECQGELD